MEAFLEIVVQRESAVPERIQVDNCGEFISKDMDRWAYENGYVFRERVRLCYMAIAGEICMQTTKCLNQIEKFIYDELDKLLTVDGDDSSCNVVEKIYKYLMSTKFRRKAACDKLKQRIKEAIVYDVERSQPINITFLQGCYKLWRFEEFPEADWAELFALMHYAEWVKPILSLYQPGVVFDFYVDDLIMERISNYRRDEIISYQHSFQKVMDFIMSHCPKNLHYKITTVSSQYADESDFWNKLDIAVARWKKPESIELDESMIAMVDLNYRPIPNEEHCAYWREKIMCIHDAHSAMEERLRYREASGKILAMPQHYSGADSRLFVGSTKDSYIKYWVGVGALRRKGDNFVTTVLSPKQLSDASFSMQNVTIDGLSEKNFSRIRVLES